MFLFEIKQVSTSTKNKLAVDNEIYSHISVPASQNVVMLVGRADGLVRHLNAAVKMGIKDLSKLWIVDFDSQIVDELEQHFDSISGQYQGTPHFVASDMLRFLKKWDSSNGKIYFVDFDGTMVASKYHVDLYNECLSLGVSYVSMIGATRSRDTDPYFQALNKEMGYPDVERRRNVDKETQIKERGFYKDGYTKRGIHPMSNHEILKTYLTQDSGQELLVGKNYKGAGSDTGQGSTMFAYLFKVH